ncbi:Transcriptional regulatory protein TcrA [Rhodococcus sp. 66b]|jgi:DNA-binding response OmpR family regulator|nr:Transcriptional regulatory protein TcrA [Rhodococcus sp. 66b]
MGPPSALLGASEQLRVDETGPVVRVLVVEDEVRLAETIRRGLVAEGFVTAVELNGDDGFAIACSDEFDVIVLDIMLPGKHGYDIVRDLRARGVWTPILMLSAKDGEYDLADAFDLGADDYLVKPFSFVVFLARLRALVRRGAPQRPSILTVGDLSLDPAKHQVIRAGIELTLTPREYSVLEFLMRNNGVVVTKTEIVRSVWDTNYEGDENIVEVYIGYLRKKVDLPFGTHSIETIRGIGYRFVGTA